MEFRTYLEQKALIFNEGKIVEVSFTIAPGQRNTRAEIALIKSGKGDGLWNDNKPKNRLNILLPVGLKKRGFFLVIKIIVK